MQRRTREIATAGTIAILGIALGMVAPATSMDRWDASTAVRSGLSTAHAPELSATTRRALAGLTTRQNSTMSPGMQFEVADLPGGGALMVEQTVVEDMEGSSAGVRVAAPFTANVPPDDLELAFTPHAVIEPTPVGTQARLGADLSLGDGARADSGWFVFAAAERHALFFEAGRVREPVSALDLQPYAVIGSAQAGVAYRIGPDMDLALAWMERDWAYRYGQTKWEADEEYLAASFVMSW